MSAPGSTPASDRRLEDGLSFDPDSRWLSLGRFVQEVDPDGGNRAVLNAYVELTARSRHDRIANVVQVRDADVKALAAALDLDADDLAAEIQAVLGASRAEAIRTVNRLRESRLIGGIAKAATGVVVAGTLVAGGVAVARAASEPHPVPMPIPGAATSAGAIESPPTSVPDALRSSPGELPQPEVDGPLTVDDQGNGLIPPVTMEADGTVLIPPANEDAPPPDGSAPAAEPGAED